MGLPVHTGAGLGFPPPLPAPKPNLPPGPSGSTRPSGYVPPLPPRPGLLRQTPHKVLAWVPGKPVTILRNADVVGYFVPAELAHPEWANPSNLGHDSCDKLALHTLTAHDIGKIIIRCAQGLKEDGDLADWLRDKAKAG